MTKEEYDIEVQKLEEKYKSEKAVLAAGYAYRNRKFKKDDILKSNNIIILVDTIKWSYDYSGYPYSIYYGEALKTDLKPFKKPARDKVFDSNEITKLN